MPRYIDADALLKGIPQKYVGFRYLVTNAPTADVVERKKGKWIDNKGLYRCSACNHLWSELWWTSVVPANKMYETMRFCPNCGAEMKGEEDADNRQI